MGRVELSEAETELQRAVEARVRPLLAQHKRLRDAIDELDAEVARLYRSALESIRSDRPEIPDGVATFGGQAPEKGKGRSSVVWPEKKLAVGDEVLVEKKSKPPIAVAMANGETHA